MGASFFSDLPPGVTPQSIKRLLDGDKRTIQSGGTAQILDIDFQRNDMYLVMALASRSMRWTLRIGVERAQTGEEIDVPTDYFIRIVTCASISLTCYDAINDGTPITIRSIAIPLDPSIVDVQTYLTYSNGESGFGILNPANIGANTNGTYSVPVSTVSTNLNPGNIIFFRGFTIYNHSPAGANLYVILGGFGATITPGGFTLRMVPNSYYESPFGFIGKLGGPSIGGIWDAPDAAGYANITAF